MHSYNVNNRKKNCSAETHGYASKMRPGRRKFARLKEQHLAEELPNVSQRLTKKNYIKRLPFPVFSTRQRRSSGRQLGICRRQASRRSPFLRRHDTYKETTHHPFRSKTTRPHELLVSLLVRKRWAYSVMPTLRTYSPNAAAEEAGEPAVLEPGLAPTNEDSIQTAGLASLTTTS